MFCQNCGNELREGPLEDILQKYADYLYALL